MTGYVFSRSQVTGTVPKKGPEVTTHQLAKELLRSDDVPVMASIDLSTCDLDADRRLFTDECLGVNSFSSCGGYVTVMFTAFPCDNQGEML